MPPAVNVPGRVRGVIVTSVQRTVAFAQRGYTPDATATRAPGADSIQLRSVVDLSAQLAYATAMQSSSISLCRQLLRTAHGFTNYNFREYALRMIREDFRSNRGLAGDEAVRAHENGARQLQALHAPLLSTDSEDAREHSLLTISDC